jgi:two-component system chemotaxis sensor kinase CheA
VDELIQEFLVESNENLDRFDGDLVKLEAAPESKELLSSIFRSIHSIKGACGFLGFQKLEKLAHAGENLLSKLRDGQLRLTAEIGSALLEAGDRIRQMLAAIGETGADGEQEYQELIERLKRLQEEDVTPSLVDQTVAVSVDEPQLEAASLEGPTRDPVCVPAEGACPPLMAEVVESRLAGEVSETPAATDEGLRTPEETRAKSGAQDSTIRVNVTVLDRLMTLVGELVLARNQLLQFANTLADSSFHTISQHMNLIATELQEEVMKTRMQPIGNIWSKFPRTVRDLVVSCGKEVRIEMEGKETELDKTIIEAIKDPLTHLVRNSVDHGIELPGVRVKAGKDPVGVLTLRAFHEGGQVNIEIADDGAGLNVERIRAKAVERGVVSAEQAARMRESEIFNLIFLPGFSTAAKVTNVSGRGVGMDVVKTNIERIGGTVDVQSKAGRGTSIRVKIPLTLAIIPALVVTCDENRFAIPQVALTELVSLEAGDARGGIETVHGAPVYRLRGQLLVGEVLSASASTALAGTAASGEQALAKIEQLRPDVVTLDVEMPGIDGLETLRQIRQRYPKLPVIMFSSLTMRGAAATLEALALGATDYATKPSNTENLAAAKQQMERELLGKIAGLGQAAYASGANSIGKPPAAHRPVQRRIDIVAIGTSTGGPNALAELIPQLPVNLPVPIVIVQHMPPLFTKLLAERLNAKTDLAVAEGQAGCRLGAGHIWVAPGDYHLTVVRKGVDIVLELNQDAAENSCRPAVDVLFRSVARTHGPHALGVVLTGMGADGAKGAKAICDAGGEVIVQDEASSVVWGMPGAVVSAGLTDEIYPLKKIPSEIVRRVSTRRWLTAAASPVKH